MNEWLKVDHPGIKTFFFENIQTAIIKYDYDHPMVDHATVMGDVTIIGLPLSWIHLKITWLQNQGYKKILVMPVDEKFVTKPNPQKHNELAPGLPHGHTDEQFEAWMKTDPPGIKTTIDKNSMSVRIGYDRPGDNSKIWESGGLKIAGNPWTWIFLRTAWYSTLGYKGILVSPM